MKRKSSRSVGPYVVALMGLALLSGVALRLWRSEPAMFRPDGGLARSETGDDRSGSESWERAIPIHGPRNRDVGEKASSRRAEKPTLASLSRPEQDLENDPEHDPEQEGPGHSRFEPSWEDLEPVAGSWSVAEPSDLEPTELKPADVSLAPSGTSPALSDISPDSLSDPLSDPALRPGFSEPAVNKEETPDRTRLELPRAPAPRFFAPVAPPVSQQAGMSAPPLETPFVPDELPTRDRPLFEVARRIEPTSDSLPPPSEMRVPRQAVIRDGVATGAWPRPAALYQQLESFRDDPLVRDWSREVISELDKLSAAPSLSVERVTQILERLEELADLGREWVREMDRPDAELTARVTRACHGISRRLHVWGRVHQLVQEERTWAVSADYTTLEEALREVETLFNSAPAAQTWNRYLLVDRLREEVDREARDEVLDPQYRRQLGRRVLQRMNSDKLTAEQREFLTRPSVRQLADQLRLWAYEPLDYTRFLRQIESHEVRLTEGTVGLAEDWQSLRWSPWEETADLARILDTHYRNANLRLTVSSEMINRMLPEVEVSEEPVNDRILGARVNGRSATSARLSVQLIPDELRLRMGLVARGHVASQTRSNKGPVTFFNNGATRYQARKYLTVDGSGVQLEDTLSEADSASRLTNVSTDFDRVPLVGSLVRSIAVREHRERLPEAKAEVEFKVGSQAARRLDEEVVKKLAEAEQRYREKLVEPLNRLRLNPAVHDLQTTDEDLVVRYRLAADHQLAAYTPRPTPPESSLFSLQIHESVLNNLLGQLQLEGRRQEVEQWMGELADKFQLQAPPRPEQLDQEVHVEFARWQPIHVRLDDGHVDLTLRFRSLTMGRSTWNDFEVATRFAPQVQGGEISLVRDDFIEIRGARLGFRDRLPLRGIFTALFTKERTFPLVTAGMWEDARWEGLEVTQSLLRDGWWGVAYGSGASQEDVP